MGFIPPYFIFQKRFLTVAKWKPLGRKTGNQGGEESSAPEFILFVQG